MRLVKELLLAGSLTMAACAERQTTVEMAETRETIKEKLLAELGASTEGIQKDGSSINCMPALSEENGENMAKAQAELELVRHACPETGRALKGGSTTKAANAQGLTCVKVQIPYLKCQ